MNLAHGLVGPADVWGAWSVDVAVIAVLAGSAVVYARGIARLRRAGAAKLAAPRRIAAFSAGVVLLGAALLSPIDALAGTLFAAHMVQHLLLLVVVPPLIVYGIPVLASVMGLPGALRRSLQGMQRHRAVRDLHRAATNPVVVWALHVGVLWVWHVPAFYQAAVRHDGVHALEHGTFLGTALLFWALVIQNGKRTRPGYGAAALLVFAAALQSAALGVTLLFAPSVIYPIYDGGARLWGLPALVDQQIAGAIMWVPTGIVYFGAIVVLLARWLHAVDARMKRKDARRARMAEATR